MVEAVVLNIPTIVPAYELIGREGQFRLPGGHRVYEAALYNDARARSDRVRLAYLTPELRQVNRYVDWESPVEVLVLY